MSCLSYNAIVLPIFDYANFISMSTSKNFTYGLQIMQNKFARCVLNAHPRDHSIEMLNALQWLNVYERADLLKACYVYRILVKEVPYYLQNIFSINQRHSDQSILNVPQTKNNAGKNTLSYSGSVLWNQIPIETKIGTLPTFKKNVELYLLNHRKFKKMMHRLLLCVLSQSHES